MQAGKEAAPDTGEIRTVRKHVSSLKPSPENGDLYAPVDVADPDFVRLAESVARNGPHDPLVITADNYIVSGHRRHAACLVMGVQQVRCRVLPGRRDSWTRDEYVAMLREYNRHRHKSVAEQVREEMVDIDPEQAHARLREIRDKSVDPFRWRGVKPVKIEGRKVRHAISDDKADHVKYILEVLEGRRRYWPLTVRGVHYPLLNYDFVRGYYWPKSDEEGYRTRQVLKYLNDDGSYGATSDLLTRLRLDGTVPWEAITDGTRPLREFRAFSNAKHFVRQEVENLFAGYWRDLLQTQPNYVHILVEKNTVYHMVLQVAEKYQVPTSSGRGFNSIDPYHEVYASFEKSGKERLILIVLSDYDPEGEMIPHVAGRTLRDDFGLDDSEVAIVKAGVTRDQIRAYHLPAMTFAKDKSPNYKWFVKRNGGDRTVYELEALDPASMLADLEKAVQAVLDIDLFNRESRIEQDEAVYLEGVRRASSEALKGLATDD
jgi:hypothetical protein